MNIEEEQPFKLNIQIKGDTLLYYKRKLSKVEKTIEVYRYWGSIWVWLYIVFALETIAFLTNIISHNIQQFPNNINFFLFKDSTILYPKPYLYSYTYISLLFFLITLGISYKLFYSRRPLSYLLLIASSVCLVLLVISLCKLIQMRLSIFY